MQFTLPSKIILLLGLGAMTKSCHGVLWRRTMKFCLWGVEGRGMGWSGHPDVYTFSFFWRMDWLWSTGEHYFRKALALVQKRTLFWTWIDFSPEVWTILEDEMTLVHKCTLFSKMDWRWFRTVHWSEIGLTWVQKCAIFSTWTDFGLELYTILKTGLPWVQKCTLRLNIDWLWCRHYFLKCINFGLKV